MQIKQFIKENIIGSNGFIVSSRCNEKWFMKRGFSKEYDFISTIDFDVSLSGKINIILDDIKIRPICAGTSCNKYTTFYQNKSFEKFCSAKCAANSDTTKLKKTETFVKHFGENWKATITKPMRCKSRSQEANSKRNETNLARYGNVCSLQGAKTKEKVEQTMNERYGSSTFFSSDTFKESDYSCNISQSKMETLLFEYCVELLGDDKVISNDRTVLNGKELDIYIPSRNLAIEYNGLYWHSDKFIDSNYHKEKTDKCLAEGINLLHIFEGEDINKWKDVIKNKLLHGTKIHARKCTIKEINSRLLAEFLSENHLQGSCNSSIRYGLYHANELVSVMSFSKSRFNKKYDWELIRFCSKSGVNVMGGASKLLSHFKKNNNGTIISYANRRWSNGNLYKTLGFTQLTSKIVPNYFYWNGKNGLETRNKYQKHKLMKLFPGVDRSLSEKHIMKEHGFLRIYDSGNLAFFTE